MLLQAWSICSAQLSPSFSHSHLLRGKSPTSSSSTIVCVSVGIDEIAQVAHNKVLISAGVSAAIGQLSKPFTSVIIYGNRNNFNWKAAFQAGGFPSTHSSAVVATAMSLGLERGFSDAVFGLAVVYASLVMYDAQGVRREVGIHAKALNRVLLQNSNPSNDSRHRKPSSIHESYEPMFLEEVNSCSSKEANDKPLLGSEKRKDPSGIPTSFGLAPDVEGGSEDVGNSQAVLKESIGHSEIEVVAGAFFGLFVCLAVYTTT